MSSTEHGALRIEIPGKPEGQDVLPAKRAVRCSNEQGHRVGLSPVADRRRRVAVQQDRLALGNVGRGLIEPLAGRGRDASGSGKKPWASPVYRSGQGVTCTMSCRPGPVAARRARASLSEAVDASEWSMQTAMCSYAVVSAMLRSLLTGIVATLRSHHARWGGSPGDGGSMRSLARWCPDAAPNGLNPEAARERIAKRWTFDWP